MIVINNHSIIKRHYLTCYSSIIHRTTEYLSIYRLHFIHQNTHYSDYWLLDEKNLLLNNS